MPTLWEILTKKQDKEPVEFKYFNPLKLRIDNHVRINTIELESYDFTLRELREVTRQVGGNQHALADYIITTRPLNGELIKKKLRVIKQENSDVNMKGSDLAYSVLLLELLDEFEYNQEFHEGLTYEKNKGEFQEGEDMYWRVNELQEPWNCTIKNIADLDANGKVEINEVKDGTMTYWDFWRETKDEGENEVLEFYIVEMDSENGLFQIWRGREVDQNRVEIV